MKFTNSDGDLTISVESIDKYNINVKINDLEYYFRRHRIWERGVVLYKKYLFIPFYPVKMDLEILKLHVYSDMHYILMNVLTGEYIKRVHPKSFEKLSKTDFYEIINENFS